LARWGKYPPLGGRGLSSVGGNTDYRRITDNVAAMAEANRGTLTIAQVETVPAIAAAEAIAATPGIDALLVGPNDLAVALGHPNNLLSEAETAAIAGFARAARAHGKIFGIHAPADFLARWTSHGLTLAMNNIDLNILANGLAGVHRDTRQLFPAAKP
jgi:2-keto-3-deoxy-L-rhamnonate aldolase RhmA